MDKNVFRAKQSDFFYFWVVGVGFGRDVWMCK